MRYLIIFLLVSFSLCSNLLTQYFWTEQVSGVTSGLHCVSNIDAVNAWVCGTNGVVLKTSNSGYNWVNLSGVPTSVNLIHIFGINSTTAITAGIISQTACVYRTSDAGASWSLVFYQDGGFVDGIWMKDSLNGFMEGIPVAGRWSLWKTTNGGINWDSTGQYLPQSGTEHSWGNSVWGFNNNIWFATNRSKIYYSPIGSPPWTPQSTGGTLNVRSIWLATDGMSGFASGDSVLRTTNGGQNWTRVPTSFSFGNTIYAITGMNGTTNSWLILNNSNIYFSAFGGPYSIQYTAPSGIISHLASARTGPIWGPGAIYAVRQLGGISRLNYFVEGVTIISNEIPAAFTLHQNYPNPFNATTVFKFENPKLSTSIGNEVRGGYVRLITYNALGQEVGSLVNEVLQPGTYKVEWNRNDLASGIYFYRLLVTDPNSGSIIYSESKKMVMVK